MTLRPVGGSLAASTRVARLPGREWSKKMAGLLFESLFKSLDRGELKQVRSLQQCLRYGKVERVRGMKVEVERVRSKP